MPRKKRVSVEKLPTPRLTPVNIILSIVLFTIIGVIFGSITTYFILKNQKPAAKTQNELTKEFYDTENAAVVSPHTIRQYIDTGNKNYILVDLRSTPEYETEHIITAINIPAATLSKDEVVKQFKKLPKNKEIIVHCYSASCMLGRETGKLLSDNGIYVKEMNIGWSEWRNFWSLWNPGEDPSIGTNYIVSGKQPGSPAPITPTPGGLITPCKQGELGC